MVHDNNREMLFHDCVPLYFLLFLDVFQLTRPLQRMWLSGCDGSEDLRLFLGCVVCARLCRATSYFLRILDGTILPSLRLGC